MWTLEQVAHSRNMNIVANLSNEVSVALYVKQDVIRGHHTYDKVGDSSGVELPNINDVISGCKINKTNQVILVHNHPYLNGDCDASPSDADLLATQSYQLELKKYGIELLDHIIVCPKGYFSFKQSNLI